MSEPKSQQEPSMEEILASIRRIISEDGTPEEKPGDAAAENAAAEPEAGPVAAEPEDNAVLELTQVMEDEAPEGGVEAPEGGVLAAAEPDEAPEQAVADPQRPPAGAGGGLLSAAAAGAAESRLSSLVAAVDRAHGGTPIGAGNRTIEDLVKEVMRSMIKDWLDAHLPALVERIVRREVERLSRRAEGEE